MSDPVGRATNSDIAVLICDDSSSMRTLLRVVIGLREGMSVAGEAGDGDEAIAQAELLQPDVVILDLSMPLRTGLEALPEINLVAPAAAVIILSGFAAAVVVDDVVGCRVAGYLQKGCEPDAILAAIEEAAGLTISDGPGRN